VSPVTYSPLPVSFYARDTAGVARGLLGCLLESRVQGRRVVGRIVEVEAYVGAHDPADHGFGGRRSRRNDALFGPPGTAYVFRSYGVHWCLNAVTEQEGVPTAVLLRALEPVRGLRTMSRRRGVDDPRLLCSGPGRLCQALGVTGDQNGARLDRGVLRILRSSDATAIATVTGPRIGISRAADWPLRFSVRGSPWLSRPAAD
jgi:DNA-3-methyladenine glycosylase